MCHWLCRLCECCTSCVPPKAPLNVPSVACAAECSPPRYPRRGTVVKRRSDRAGHGVHASSVLSPRRGDDHAACPAPGAQPPHWDHMAAGAAACAADSPPQIFSTLYTCLQPCYHRDPPGRRQLSPTLSHQGGGVSPGGGMCRCVVGTLSSSNALAPPAAVLSLWHVAVPPALRPRGRVSVSTRGPPAAARSTAA